MSLKWEILLSVIRLLFVLAPFMNIRGRRFGLAGNSLTNAREFANAANSRAMIVTFPVEVFVRTLAEADARGATCQKSIFTIAVYVVVVGALAFAVLRIPTLLFRAWLLPILWFIIVTVLSVLVSSYRLSWLVNPICSQG